jgi:hypothetical protein
MQDIVSYYKNTEPSIDVRIGSNLHVFRFRDAMARIKNVKNSKYESGRIRIRKLEEYQFIAKATADTFIVLDIGKDWSD